MTVKNRYYHYYLQQAGGSFHGPVFQRGNGLGSIFKSLVRFITPIIKPAAKALGREAVGIGSRWIGDISSGEDPQKALKKNLKIAGSNLLHTAGDSVRNAQFGSGRRRKTRPKSRKVKRRKLDFLA